jgi:hypothetical protein
MKDLELRALMPDDAGVARALVSEQFANTRYRARALELLDSALRFDDPEFMAILAFTEGGQTLVGLVLFGTVAGARSVVKVHGIVARERETAVALLDAVRAASEHSGERMIVCELPDDAPFAVASDALEATGFAEEGRVPDFVRDGVALRLLVHPLHNV